MSKLKTFEVKFAYQGYQVIRVKAKDQYEAYEKAEDEVGEDLCLSGPSNEELPAPLANFLATMNREPDEDDTIEVEPEAPIDEDRVTFGPLTLPEGRDFIILGTDDTLIDRITDRIAERVNVSDETIDRMIEREG